jgi:hypothetical protein
MVGEVNTALAWQADSMAATAGSMTAAAGSAAAASASATAAAGSVVSAQAQVGLAAQQAGNAAASSNSAQVAAAAAGSAVGLPSLVGNSTKALVVKTNETGVEFKAIGQAIGDFLETSRIPDETYILPDTVYSRAAYPELSIILGTVGVNRDGASWVTVSNSLSTGARPTAIVFGKDNVAIAVNGTPTGCARSTDGGATWAPLVGANSPGSVNGRWLATDENGVWISTGNSGAGAVRSLDNGLTWTAIATGLSSAAQAIATDKLGNWLVGSSSAGNTAKSTNNGQSWIVLTNAANGAIPGAANSLHYDGTSWYVDVSSTAPYFTRSFGGRFTAVMYRGQSAAVVDGTLMAKPGFACFYNVYSGFNISVDGGYSWRVVDEIDVSSVTLSGNTVIAVSNGVMASVFRSDDKGETWVQAPLGDVFSVYPNGVGTNGEVLGASYANTNSYVRSVRQFNYDASTQFKTPAKRVGNNFKCYIKGKLQ